MFVASQERVTAQDENQLGKDSKRKTGALENRGIGVGKPGHWGRVSTIDY